MAISPSIGSPSHHRRPELCLLSDDPPAVRGGGEAQRLADAHAWLVERALARLAAWWPEEVDPQSLRQVGRQALVHAAGRVADPADLPPRALEAVEEALRRRLCSDAWYAHAISRRLQPLCAAWRGALLAGRAPTDHLLCMRLYLVPAELATRFRETALIMALDPAALLPPGRDLATVLPETITQLPDAQQLVTALYFEECMTFEEIGRVMGTPAVRVQELMGRAGTAIFARAGQSRWATRVVSA